MFQAVDYRSIILQRQFERNACGNPVQKGDPRRNYAGGHAGAQTQGLGFESLNYDNLSEECAR